jgi:hypothetical protein
MAEHGPGVGCRQPDRLPGTCVQSESHLDGPTRPSASPDSAGQPRRLIDADVPRWAISRRGRDYIDHSGGVPASRRPSIQVSTRVTV